MFRRIADGIIQYFQQETRSERLKRMIPGAIYSILAISLFSVVSSVINVIVFRNLHLAVNWVELLLQLVEFAIAMAIAGAVVGWFTETYEAIIWGGLILAILLLVGNLLATLISGRGITLIGQSLIITILPVFIAGMLVAGAIRMSIRRHLQVAQQKDPVIQRRMSAQLIVLVCLVGLIIGGLSLFGTTSLNAIHGLNDSLQNFATDPLFESRFPYAQLPGLKSHFGMQYSLYAHISYLMTSYMEITIRFRDGYTFTCLVPQLSSNEALILNNCNQGTSLRSP